jgi:HD-like signal output (HDOD) protein
MKSWLNKIMGGGTSADQTQAGAADDQGQQAAADADAELQIDQAYYKWLVWSAAYKAPEDVENRILDELAALAERPEAGAILVPRVPELMTRLLSSLADEDASVQDLAREVGQDVVLVAEVLREANSAYYSPPSPVKSLDAAIMMLGQNGLRMLLARIAFRPVVKLQSEAFAKRVAPQVWDHSSNCALAASLIAPGLRAGMFEAYLAGLMQNVGLMVAFRLCDRFCEAGKVPVSSEFGVELLARSRQLSASIAAHWDFPAEVCEAMKLAGTADAPVLAKVLLQADRMAKLRLLIDAGVMADDDPLATTGMDAFQRRCMGKLGKAEQ